MLRMTVALNAAADATEDRLPYPIHTRQVGEADQRAAEGEERLVDLVVAGGNSGSMNSHSSSDSSGVVTIHPSPRRARAGFERHS